jgi:hypothetical protein
MIVYYFCGLLNGTFWTWLHDVGCCVVKSIHTCLVSAASLVLSQKGSIMDIRQIKLCSLVTDTNIGPC